MMDEDFEFEEPEPQERSNRTFRIAAIALGGLLVLSLICLGLYMLVVSPMLERANVSGTATAIAATQIAQAQPSEPSMPTAVLATATNTPIPVLQPTSTEGPATATLAATLPPTAIATATPTPTPTALPATGFADEINLPQLAIVALALVIIVLMARRIRVGIMR